MNNSSNDQRGGISKLILICVLTVVSIVIMVVAFSVVQAQIHIFPAFSSNSGDTTLADPDTLDLSFGHGEHNLAKSPSPNKNTKSNVKRKAYHEEHNRNVNQWTTQGCSIYNCSDSPIIIGQEYCVNNEKYNDFTHLRVEGMYNSGTNALYKLLNTNCFGTRALRRSFAPSRFSRSRHPGRPKVNTRKQNEYGQPKSRNYKYNRNYNDINYNDHFGDRNHIHDHNYNRFQNSRYRSSPNNNLRMNGNDNHNQNLDDDARGRFHYNHDTDLIAIDEIDGIDDFGGINMHMQRRNKYSNHDRPAHVVERERARERIREKEREESAKLYVGGKHRRLQTRTMGVTSAGGDPTPRVKYLNELQFENININITDNITKSNNKQYVLNYLEDNIFPNMHYIDTVYRSVIGKHHMNPTQDDLKYYKHAAFRQFSKIDETLNVIIIKHPLTWIKSLCKHSYDVSLLHYPPKKNTNGMRRKPPRKKPPSNIYDKPDQPLNHNGYTCPTNFGEIITDKNKQKLTNFFDDNDNDNDKREEYYGSLTWHGMYWNSIIEFYNQWYLSWFSNKYNDTKTTSNQSPHDETVYWTYDFGKKNFEKSTSENINGIDGEANNIRYQWSNWGSKDGFELNIEQQKFMKHLGHTMEIPAKIPTIVVRFEDLLFDPQRVTTGVCDCIGGVMRKRDNTMDDRRVKNDATSRTRTQALQIYSNPNYQYETFTQEDIEFVRQNIDKRLLDVAMYTV